MNVYSAQTVLMTLCHNYFLESYHISYQSGIIIMRKTACKYQVNCDQYISCTFSSVAKADQTKHLVSGNPTDPLFNSQELIFVTVVVKVSGCGFLQYQRDHVHKHSLHKNTHDIYLKKSKTVSVCGFWYRRHTVHKRTN